MPLPAPRGVPTESAALLDRYFVERAQHIARSISTYRRDLEAFAADLAPSQLTAATRADIAAFFNARVRDERTPGDTRPWVRRTAYRALAALHGFYSWALDSELIAADPTRRYEMKRAVDTREPERVERGDFDDVFEWIDKEIGHAESDLDGAPWILDRALLRYLDILGLRIHEACGIRLSHFRRHGRELRVSITGKGGRIDEFPVVGSLLEAHRSWLRVRDTVQPAQGHEDYLFLNVSRKKGYGHVVSRQRAWERLKRIAANLGWDAERRSLLSPHAFRHGRAFEMLDSGMYNIEEVRAYLRHRSVVTTQGYVEATRDSVHRAAREQAGA